MELIKILLITEKCSPNENQRDGGARLVETLQRALGHSLSIMQFGKNIDSSATWHYEYPFDSCNRFERRLLNANFIAEKVKAVEHLFTHLIFIHISMQFGLVNLTLREDINIWTFPMFLTPSYMASGEVVPQSYLEIERLTLANSKNILTPSHLEKRQLMEFYSISQKYIHVVPRGVDTQILDPKVRSLNGPPKFCSVGSIKPQKNTLGLIRLFSKIRARFLGATLRLIGPVQNSGYYDEVLNEIDLLGLHESVEFAGYVPPGKYSSAIEDIHLHLSTSVCETFGRSIFETLASGLPNIARSTGNAATEFLEHLPYARFVDDDNDALNMIEEMLSNLPKLSSMAIEIGEIYDDEILSKLLLAEICNKDYMAVSDFDGTLYHKNDQEKTKRCIKAFKSYTTKVLCSARTIEDLLEQLKLYDLEVDWIIGCSGSIITNGVGTPLWVVPLNSNIFDGFSGVRPIEIEGTVLQIAIPENLLPSLSGLRYEVYQGTAFVSNWEASKFRAVHRLLRYVNWLGRVRVFGDGPYDVELLTYFNGILITNSPNNEVINA